MFARRYWAGRYFAPRYWPVGGGGPPPGTGSAEPTYFICNLGRMMNRRGG